MKGELQNDADINANTNEEHLRHKLWYEWAAQWLPKPVSTVRIYWHLIWNFLFYRHDIDKRFEIEDFKRCSFSRWSIYCAGEYQIRVCLALTTLYNVVCQFKSLFGSSNRDITYARQLITLVGLLQLLLGKKILRHFSCEFFCITNLLDSPPRKSRLSNTCFNPYQALGSGRVSITMIYSYFKVLHIRRYDGLGKKTMTVTFLKILFVCHATRSAKKIIIIHHFETLIQHGTDPKFQKITIEFSHICLYSLAYLLFSETDVFRNEELWVIIIF